MFPIKIKMKYDSLGLKAGDVVEAKDDAEYRNLTGRGGQIVDGKAEKKSEEKILKAEKEAKKKAEKETKERQSEEEAREKAAKDEKKGLESKKDKTLDKE